MNRRKALAYLGASAGAAAAAAYGRVVLLFPPPSPRLAPAEELALRLHESFDEAQRAQACVEYDHPLRQVHNAGMPAAGIPANAWSLDGEQRQLVTDLLHAALSAEGRERLPRQQFLNVSAVHSPRVLVCGDPRAGEYQIIVSAVHLNLRIGGKSKEGAAFGGPQVYGDQRGNFRPGLPGNVYRYQYEIAHRLYRSLPARLQSQALLPKAPIQTQIQVQGEDGAFPGVAVAQLGQEGRTIAAELVTAILSTYAPDDAAYARACIDRNGGVERLFLSYYRETDDGPSGECQVFRLEGPAAVFHFLGHPHVHAFINVAADGAKPLSVGEVIATARARVEGVAVKNLFERALLTQTDADLAYFPLQSVVGALRRGPVRTGDVYTLESWRDRVVTVEMKGAEIGGALRQQLRAEGGEPAAARLYSVATTRHVTNVLGSAEIGRFRAPVVGPLLRDAVIAHLRRAGVA